MSQLLFDFKDFATPKVISKKITTEFNKAANVTPVNVEVSPKTRRDSGVSFREIFAMFADNQTVTLRVKQSGDIYKVLINNKLLPIKNQDNHAKAIGEICSAMEKGRSAFQKKLAKTKITLPPSVKSTIVSKQQALDNKKTALLEAIDAVQNELNAVNAEIDDFQNKIDTGNKTISDAQVIMPDSQHNTTSVAELTREATDRLNQHADQPSGQEADDVTASDGQINPNVVIDNLEKEIKTVVTDPNMLYAFNRVVNESREKITNGEDATEVVNDLRDFGESLKTAEKIKSIDEYVPDDELDDVAMAKTAKELLSYAEHRLDEAWNYTIKHCSPNSMKKVNCKNKKDFIKKFATALNRGKTFSYTPRGGVKGVSVLNGASSSSSYFIKKTEEPILFNFLVKLIMKYGENNNGTYYLYDSKVDNIGVIITDLLNNADDIIKSSEQQNITTQSNIPNNEQNTDTNSQNADATPEIPKEVKDADKKFLNDMFFASESTFQSEDDVRAALAKVKEIEQKYSATNEFKSLISQAEESLNGLLNISNTSSGLFLKQRIDMFKKTIQDKEALFNSIDVSKIDVDKSKWDANEKIIKDASNKIAEIENKINNGISIFEFQSVANELNRIRDDIPDTALQQFLSDINYFVDLWQTKITKEKDNWSDSDIANAVDTLKNFKATNIEIAGQAFVSAAINYVNEIDEMINTLSQSLNKAPSELETLVKNKFPALDDAIENLSKQLGNKEIRKVSNLAIYSTRKVLRTDPAFKSYLDSLPDKSIASNIRAKLEAIPPEEIKKPFDERFEELNRKYSDAYCITEIRNLAKVLANYDFCLDYDVFKKDNVNNLTDEQKIEMIEATNPNIYMYSKTQEYNAHPELSLMTDAYCKKVGINLTNADKLAIFSYIGPSMNSMLNFANNEGIWSTHLETYSEILSQALNKLPKYQGTIMRGERFNTEYDFLSRLDELKSNSSYVKSFLSTTIKKNTANDYAGWDLNHAFSIKMNIKAKSAVFIDFMVMPKLQQLILPKGAKLKYISHEISGDDNNKCEIFLEEI